MKVLHITCWFPNKNNPSRAVFIKKQIEALSQFADNTILHFEVIKSSSFKKEKIIQGNLEQTILHTPIFIWPLIEILHFFWLYLTLVIRKRSAQFDVINFHIAYPMLVYWKYIKKKINRPVLISEHWSAYRNNFGSKKKLTRIKNIFCQKIPVVAVSNALIQDIRTFSNCEFKSYLLPNVIDSKIFFPLVNKKNQSKSFLMCSFWKAPKRPFLVLESFKRTVLNFPDIRLKIIGRGPQISAIKKWVIDNEMKNHIHILGAKGSTDIAQLMREADIFLHPSDYETFSVVCAEAMACGLPLVASKVGAIPEITNRQAILVENEPEAWYSAINQVLEINFERPKVQENPFGVGKVGKLYFETLKSVINDAER